MRRSLYRRPGMIDCRSHAIASVFGISAYITLIVAAVVIALILKG